MSDVDYSAPFDASDFILREQKSAKITALDSLDDDPEKAARAQQLADATGEHPALVYGDLENFETQHKAALTNELLSNNQFLQSYVNSHPLAAKISNDDYGQLDAVSQAVGRLSGGPSMGDDILPPGTRAVLGVGIEGFKANANFAGLFEELRKLDELMASGTMRWNIFRPAILAGTFTLTGAQALFGGVVGGSAAAVGEAYKQAGGNEAMANRLTRDLIILAQVGLAGQAKSGAGTFTRPIGPEPKQGLQPGILSEAEGPKGAGSVRSTMENAASTYGEFSPEVIKSWNPEVLKNYLIGKVSQTAAEVHKATEPYVVAGKEPPVGVHPIVDGMKVDQAKIDADNLTEALKESVKSATRERSPDLFTSFVAQHTNEGQLGISADAVRKLYGDKVPVPGEGPLGFVPDLAAQLARAEKTGGDIQVDVAKYLGHVEPEVHKALEDHIRARPEGMTVEESKSEVLKWEQGVNGGADVSKLPEAVRQLGAPLNQDTTFYRGEAEGRPELGDEKGTTSVSDRAGGDSFALARGDQLIENAIDAPHQGLPISEIQVPKGTQVLDVSKLGGKNAQELERMLPPGRFTKVGERREPYKVGDIDVGHHITTYKFEPYEQQAVDTIRQAAGLQGQIPKPSLSLQRSGPESDGFHTFDVMGKDGEQKATLDLRESGNKKTINIEMLTAREGVGAIGQKGLVTIAEEIAREFPTAEKIDYHHISGAKGEKPVSEIGNTSIDLGPIRERMAAREAAAPKGPEVQGLLQRAKEAVVGKKPKTPEQLELDLKAIEERDLFDKASAIGMTVDQYKRYAKLINERAAEDAEAASKRALADQAKRQTKEWKANRAELRPQVREEVLARPDVELDEMLREGKVKLAADALTPDQRALLPKDFVAADGIHPEDLANLFGDRNAAALVDRVIALGQGREAAGMKPKPHLERLVDAETDRQMEAKYGSLDKNILDEAKDQVLSETQESLLHEEVLARAEEAGMQLTITKDELKAAIKDLFDRSAVKDVSSDKGLAEAGRAGRAAEMALLKGDYAEAFRQKQRQFNAFTMATYAKKFEKVVAQFEKSAKRFSSREVPGVSQEYTNWVHDILGRVGSPVKRSVQDLQDAIAQGEFKTLSEFVNYKQRHDLRDLPVADFLLDPYFKTKADNLTTQQFEELNKSVETMAFNGRDELKIERAGDKEDLRAVINEMTEKMATLSEHDYPVDRPRNKVIEHTKSWWWSGITVESILNRLDRDNPRGVFNETIVRPFTEASNYKDRLVREYQDKISKIGNIPDMDKLIENSFLMDPITERPLILRKRNLLGILQNIGNDGNISKLAQGYKVAPETLMSWVLRNTEKADWDRAQAIGDLFEEIFEKANVMSRNVSGVDVEKIPLKPIETPFGTYKGWYNPIKYDSLRPGESKTLLGQGIEQEGYYRATTPQGYAKGRTGYVAPIELNLDVVPERMKQMLHDIAMRPAVIQIGKIFYDPAFKRAMIKHVGQHRAEEMIPFLRDIANASNFQSLSASMGNQALEYFRQNTIATLIGFNPGTVMKHGTTALINSMSEVGAVNFMREFKNVVTDLPQGAENWKLAMEKSEELQRRMRNFSELIAGHGSEINLRGARSNFASFREFMMSAGATPVSLSDLASAVPTWLAQYKTGIAAGLDEGRAVSDANRAVRRAHGSSVFSNKPAIARTNALGATFSSLYGFFSHMQQKQYELAWKAADAWKDKFGKGSGDAEDTARHTPDLVKGFFSYIVLPAVIEELVTPYTNSEKDSWGMKAAKTLGLGLSASFIGVRDFVRGLINLRDPSAGLIGTSLKAATDLGRDLSQGRKAFTKDKAGNLINHTFALTGVLTGLTNAQEGKVLQYLYNFSQGREHPKGPWGVASGLRFGKSDHHSQTFEQWRKGH